MNYELYRRTTLGECLTDSLDELIQSAQITPQLAMKVLLQFDKCMNEALSDYKTTRTTVKGHLHTYRFCDEVWTFVLENATVRLQDGAGDTLLVDKLKIIACNARRNEAPHS